MHDFIDVYGETFPRDAFDVWCPDEDEDEELEDDEEE